MSKGLKIVLLGYMASGKSTVGELLSQKLNLPFKDLDDEIEQVVGMSVEQIFDKKGELFFRKKETEILKQVMGSEDGFVLALGGGTPCYANNIDIVHINTSNTFYLKLTIGSLVSRISREKDKRPLVANIMDHDLPEFVGKHIFERNQFYLLAKQIIDCNQKSVEDIAKEISRTLI
ncbi:shikimate kinase [Croceitalea rosinachiae]|uniref:Shikimate kinase n=1 Tax=Croceitalea rosinachiae TaxID=3075596 RepID=A0ABU3AEI4_9FLAO|nr:shikimate kinase [Croceitalea sp. F388]MDT0608328.1 shikimate kinase [Croceitalea sp. F388]